MSVFPSHKMILISTVVAEHWG